MWVRRIAALLGLVALLALVAPHQPAPAFDATSQVLGIDPGGDPIELAPSPPSSTGTALTVTAIQLDPVPATAPPFTLAVLPRAPKTSPPEARS